MNQPLREKLEAWRAQKSQGQARESPPTECADKTAPRSWYRSVPTARRNNLILKPSDPAKVGAKSCSSKMFSKKDPKDIHCNAENVEQNVPASICHPKRESIAKEDKISEKDIIIKKLREENEELAFKLKETTNNLKVAVTRGRLAMEEVAAVNFQNDILQQENLELDCKISSERMDVNENASEKSRKHKLELEKLQREKDQYEKRADDMILQMNEQMTQLQTVAMDRIQDLEQQLMEEQNNNSQLEQTIRGLKTQLQNKRVVREEEDEEDDDDNSSTCSSSDTVNMSDEESV